MDFSTLVFVVFLGSVVVFSAVLAYSSAVDGGAAHGSPDADG